MTAQARGAFNNLFLRLRNSDELNGLDSTNSLPSSIISSSGAGGGLLNTGGSPSAQQYKLDKRLTDRLQKHITRALRNSGDPRLVLKASPPCLSDILPQLSQIIRQITTSVEKSNNLRSLVIDADICNAYIQECCINLIEKLKLFNGLFKDPSNLIYDERSARRKALTVLTLRLSQICSELNALFSDGGQYVGCGFRITKDDASDFWRNAFGRRISVPWNEFCLELTKVHPIQSPLETAALKTTIDLTRDNNISIFEFDVFVRLFHPWKSILKNWSVLAVSHPGYVAFLTYDEVKERLQKYIDRPGSYVFRQSCTRLGQWAIGYVTSDKRILQTIPQSRSLLQALVDGHRDGYYKYPDGLHVTIDLSSLLDEDGLTTTERINVTHEQYELYCQIGDMFEICKICSEREKDTCIEPCKHLICSECLIGWLNKNSKTCPFCREEVKGHHKVHIEGLLKEDQSDSMVDMASSNVDSPSSSSIVHPTTVSEDGTTKSLSLSELESKFTKHKLDLALQLADGSVQLASKLLEMYQSHMSESTSTVLSDNL